MKLPRSNLEHRIQSALVKAARDFLSPDQLIIGIHNGGNRSAITGAILKREGALAGVPDLFLAVARGRYHGMFIEVKTPKGRVTEKQAEIMETLADAGYYVRVVRTTQQGINAIKKYMGLDCETCKHWDGDVGGKCPHSAAIECEYERGDDDTRRN